MWLSMILCVCPRARLARYVVSFLTIFGYELISNIHPPPLHLPSRNFGQIKRANSCSVLFRIALQVEHWVPRVPMFALFPLILGVVVRLLG